MAPTCPLENTEAIDQSDFLSLGNLNWDAHRIGWAVSGAFATVAVVVSLVSVWNHCRNYNKRAEQRQILRILYMPPVYAIVSFLSYRFFRSYTYYSIAQTVYEAITLNAFLLLLIEYVADTVSGHKAEKAVERSKGRRKLPFPFCFVEYRPTKKFMYTVECLVLQYVVVQPACTIVGIICEQHNILCVSGPYNFHYANVYLAIVTIISASLALYGLLVFYGLMKDKLPGRRLPVKFLAVISIVIFTFYQSFVFSALGWTVIHATEYWTATNVADGLNALTICVEMVLFSFLLMWAFAWREYAVEGSKTRIWRALGDSINFHPSIFSMLMLLAGVPLLLAADQLVYLSTVTSKWIWVKRLVNIRRKLLLRARVLCQMMMGLSSPPDGRHGADNEKRSGRGPYT